MKKIIKACTVALCVMLVSLFCLVSCKDNGSMTNTPDSSEKKSARTPMEDASDMLDDILPDLEDGMQDGEKGDKITSDEKTRGKNIVDGIFKDKK